MQRRMCSVFSVAWTWSRCAVLPPERGASNKAARRNWNDDEEADGDVDADADDGVGDDVVC